MARRELPHKAALRRCYTRFIEDLDPAPILDHFITHDFLPFTTIRDIKEPTLSTTEKNRRIMEKVMTKDERGYRLFLKCLKDTHQPYLASLLEEQYRKFVEEAKPAAAKNAAKQKQEPPKPAVKTEGNESLERPSPSMSTPSTVPSQAHTSHSLSESKTPQRSIFPRQPRTSPSVTPSPTAQSSPNHPPAHSVSNQLQTSPSVATERRPQGSDVSDQSQPNLSLSQYLPSPPAPGRQGSEISNQSQPNPSLNRLLKDPSVATGRRPQGSDVSDRFPHDHVTSPSPTAVTSTAARPEDMGHTFPQDPTSSLVRVGFPDMSRSGSIPQSHSGNGSGSMQQLPSGDGRASIHNLHSGDGQPQYILKLPVGDQPGSILPYSEDGPEHDPASGVGGISSPGQAPVSGYQGSANTSPGTTGHQPASAEFSPRNVQSSRVGGQQFDDEMGSQQSTVSGLDHRDSGNVPPGTCIGNLAEQMITTGDPAVLDNRVGQSTTGVPDNSSTQLTGTSVLENPELFPKLSVKRQISVVSNPHDGRIISMPWTFVKQYTEEPHGTFLGSGAYGQLYKSKKPVQNMEMDIVIKKIRYKGMLTDELDENKRRSATNEILAARLMHFAIVPLLGMYEDDNAVYFLFPLLKRGDLWTLLQKDKSSLDKRKRPCQLCLKQTDRLRIIYHIASAMDFLHTKVAGFRGAYVHGDITTRNIVLDGDSNARLIDFGLARELTDSGHQTLTQSDQFGTKGYFLTANIQELSVQTDCFNFGVVLLELLTSLVPWDRKQKRKLLDRKELLVMEAPRIKDVFEPKISKKIYWMAMKCFRGVKYSFEDVNQVLTENNASSPEVSRKIVEITEKLLEGNKYSSSAEFVKELKQNADWSSEVDSKVQAAAQKCLDGIKYTPGDILKEIEDHNLLQNPNKWCCGESRKCHVCMLNNAMDFKYLESHGNCRTFKVCAACMRNSYFNPIKCPSCQTKVQPPVGDGWAAILIAGHDQKTDFAKSYVKDVNLMYKTISSRFPHVMGIREELIKCVCPITPGQEEDLKTKVKEAFNCLREKKGVKTLLFLFTGHYTEDSGFLLGSKENCMKKEEMVKEMESLTEVTKRIIFLDCCDAPVLQSDCLNESTRLQLNACGGIVGKVKQSAIVQKGIGSAFTHFLAQALSNGASTGQCFLSQSNKSFNSSKECTICSDFKKPPDDHLVNFQSLHDYVHQHTDLYSRNCCEERYDVVASNNIRNCEVKVAYHLNERPEIEFYFSSNLHESDNGTTEEVHVQTQLPECKEQLHKDLMEAFLEKVKDLPKDDLSIRKYSDIICVVVTTGPKGHNYRELDTIEKLVSAWNGKRRLHYGLRRLENLQHGKVGLFIKPGESGMKIRSYLIQANMEEMCKEIKDDRGVVVQIKARDVSKLYMALQEDDVAQDDVAQDDVAQEEEVEQDAEQMHEGPVVHGTIQEQTQPPEEGQTPSEDVNRLWLEETVRVIHDATQGTEGIIRFLFPYKNDKNELNDGFVVIEYIPPPTSGRDDSVG